MEIVVTSEPVPAVVGTNMSGSRGPLAIPIPYTSPNFSFPGARSATNLATSIELPPPNPTMKSALHSWASFTALSITETGGSASTSEKTCSESASSLN